MAAPSQRALNRALLARQLLLERQPIALPEALERVAGVQAQYAPSMYVGLWSRVADFERDALTRALERRDVVQGTLMRITIHVVSAQDYWPLAIAVRDERRKLWLRTRKGDPNAQAMAAGARKLRRALAGTAMRRNEIDALLGRRIAEGVGLWVDLVRVPPSGTWERRRADLYGLAEEWLPAPAITQAQAVEYLIRRYLNGFGPASKRDVASWTGLPLATIGKALARMDVEDCGGDLIDVPGAPRPDAETPAPVRFLPTWDASLLVHARRTGVLPEELRPRIFNTRQPQSTATFLVDGVVAGVWAFADGGIKCEPWVKLDRVTQRAVREEADRLAELVR